jgi:UDP-N-acetylmuramate dehydrogenase
MQNIRKNVDLSSLNTFKTGGNARFFCEVESENELIEALKFAKENKLEFFIIGNGSNLLLSDNDFPGIVIKIIIKGKKIEIKDADYSVVSAGAGESFDDLIIFMADNSLSGIENLWNIPGTVGASAVQNMGAYGAETKDFIFLVEGIDANNFEKFSFKNSECRFGYRESIFKKNKNLIITKVSFKLNNVFLPNFSYPSLKEYFSGRKNFDVREIIEAIGKIRREKLPDWKVLGTAGSFFKNPIITEEEYSKLLEKFPDLPRYDAGKDFVKIPLGFVIDKICLLKGFRVGQVGLFEKQSLVIVNYGGADFSEIDNFAKIIEEKVFEKIKVRIEREVENIF